jgi:hypothetical protein
MDVDFLAAGGRLERGADRPAPPLPGNAALLGSVVRGPRVDALVAAYDFLRRLEARNRWVMGRAVEILEPRGDHAAALQALLSPGEPFDALLAGIAERRARVRAAFRDVVQAGTIGALETQPPPSPERP